MSDQMARQCNSCLRWYTWAEWAELPFVGFANEDGAPIQPGERPAVELRNCDCDPDYKWHTLAVPCDEAWLRARVGPTSRELVQAERSFENGRRPTYQDTDERAGLWRDGW